MTIQVPVKWWQIGLLVVVPVFVVLLNLYLNKPVHQKGLTVRPANYIKYNPSDHNTYLQKYVHPLNIFMKKYEEAKTKLGHGVMYCSKDSLPGEGETCFFNPLWVYQLCSPEDNWNYGTEKPCILLSFENFDIKNDFEPHTVETIQTEESAAQDIKDLIQEATYENDGEVNRKVWVTCSDGQHSYTEYTGFPTYFFHNTHLSTYLPPLLGVRLNVGKKFNQDVPIECRIWAQNVNFSDEYGKVNFTVHIVK